MRAWWLALLLVCLGCSSRYGSDRGASGARISVRGSDTLVVLAERWAEVYSQKRPDLTIEVSGGGTGTGIAALMDRTADLATASRPVTREENAHFESSGSPIVVIPVALDAVAVYVHATNPVAAISKEELREVFRGHIRRWSTLGGPDKPIVLYSRESSSGTYAFFKERVLENMDFAAEAQNLPGTAAVVYAIAHDPNAIGFGGVARATSVKVLPMRLPEGQIVMPNQEAARSGRYPLTRPLFLLHPVRTKPEIEAFVSWIVGPEGQSLAEQAGFFPFRSAS